jgi:3-oxoacyl-[acyl-carrier-protein] synthase-3
MTETCNTILKKAGLTIDQVDLIIPHQANIRILKSLQKMMRIPSEKLMITIDRYGNTSAASIALALHEAREEGRLKPGSLAIMVSFGGGFTWGGFLIQT